MTDITPRLSAALADRYSIERHIGEGGMATVYLAEDLKHHRKVAVKVLRPELAEALGADRFLREITTTANLRHPHILPLYDSGEADGFLFYVMPFVQGESLRDLLDREKQLPIDTALKIAREVGDALSYAHSQDTVHRDIKPDNILIEAGHAVVADFGIARAVSSAGGTQLTETGMSIGTPLYMSPEQAAGGQDLDGRSDLYSLACVLFEMLGGQPPFSGPTPQSVVHQHIAVDPPPITNLRPAVPASIAGVLQRALSKEPADRFNPVAQFVEALPLTSATTQQPASAASSDAGVPPRPSRSRLATGVAVSIAVVVAAAFLLFRFAPADGVVGDERSVAVLPFDNISPNADDAYFADGITEEITGQLSRLGDLRVVNRTAAELALQSGGSLTDVGRTLKVKALLEGSVRMAGDRVRISAQLVDVETNDNLWSQDFDRDMSDVFAIQSEVASAIVTALDGRLSAAERDMLDTRPTDNVAAYNLYLRSRQLQGRLPDENGAAIELLRQAVSIDPSFANAWALMAWRYVWRARVGDPEGMDSAFVFAQHALELDSTSMSARYALGNGYGTLGRTTEALAQFDLALDIDPEYRGALRDGSYTLAVVGQLASSLRMASLELPQSPNVPNTRFHISIPLLLLGDDDRTEGWLRAAQAEVMEFQRLDVMRIMLDILRGRDRDALDGIQLGLERHAGNYEFEQFALFAQASLGQHADARAGLERLSRLAPNADSWLGLSISNRTRYAFVLQQSDEPAQAAALFDQSLNQSLSTIESGSELGGPRVEIAAIHAVRGDTTRALEWLERGYQTGYRWHRMLVREPMFETLRNQAGFQDLLERMEQDVARERERVEAEGIAVAVDSIIQAVGR